MGYNESNFIYLKTTGFQNYYEELVKAETIYPYSSEIAKIIIRKVTESILKDIAEKTNLDINLSTKNLLESIKDNLGSLLPIEIYNNIKYILNNTYDYLLENNLNQSTEIIKSLHSFLFWYIKYMEPEKSKLIKDITFKPLGTIDYIQMEADKIKQDILLKDKQINNLRNKIIELGVQSKSVSELNNIIIAIKDEKLNLENLYAADMKKIELQQQIVDDVENNYSQYRKKLDFLKDKVKEKKELLFEKQSQLLKAEMQKQELKVLNSELYDQDESISLREKHIVEELKLLRKSYENLLNLINEYQDIIETIEFSDDEELQNVLEKKKNNIELEINYQNRLFNENIINYNKVSSESKRKMIIFKEVINENVKVEIKYDLFYKGFLKLKNKEIKILYTIINYVSTTSNIINKPKELLGKYSEDKFLELLNINLEKLQKVSDDELKLILYYKLTSLTQNLKGHIYNIREFIQTLDGLVDRSYEMLLYRKDFKSKATKIDSIITTYLKNVIIGLRSKSGNIKFNEVILDRIFKKIIKLINKSENIHRENVYFDKFNLNIMQEGEIQNAIKSHTFDFLEIMIDLADIDTYKEVSKILFEVEMLISKRHLSKEDAELRFSNEYFIIILFLFSGALSINKKQQEELLPLLVMIIMNIELMSDDQEKNFKSYTNMAVIWKRKQKKYNSIYFNKEDEEIKLEALAKENQSLEIDIAKLASSYYTLNKRYNECKEEFKMIVMNSDKRVLLPSFLNYDQLRSKKETAENHINESKNKLGTFKSILSPEIWKEQASKIINESSMAELEKKLFEEAKKKPYFKAEYQIILDLEEKIKETELIINKEKEKLEKNKEKAIHIKSNIDDLQKQLNIIKDVYFDVEE